MPTQHLLPSHWTTPRLVVLDSTQADVPTLQSIAEACSYIHAWTGYKAEEHPDQTLQMIYLHGELPPNGTQEFFRLQSIWLNEPRQLIGFWEIYHGFPKPDCVWILYLAILPEFQGQGYGQELVKRLCELVQTLPDFPRIQLAAGLKNWPAIRFWVKAGFNQVVDIWGDKVYSENTFADLILEKTLQEAPHGSRE